jgi:DNA helicase-2/ATP-dependent DNA helicase PcrA
VIAPGEHHGPGMIPMRGEAGKVDARCFSDYDDEARGFARWVMEHRAEGGGWADCTALFRTNAQSRAFEEALLGERVPYVVVGGASFYERREVKDLLSYLRVAAEMDREGDAVKRCINAPFRFLGTAFVERVMGTAAGMHGVDWTDVVRSVASQAGIQSRQRASAEAWATLIAGLRKRIAESDAMDAIECPPEVPKVTVAGPAELLNDLVHQTGYIAWLEKEEGEESIESSHAANVRELIRVAARFRTVRELLTYIEENIAASKRQRKGSQGDRVLLMSIHRAKGLEWPKVWVAGMNQDVLPHHRGEPEEERRLAYVAVTRARDELVCGYVRTVATRKGNKKLPPSRFLVDAGLVQPGDVEID